MRARVKIKSLIRLKRSCLEVGSRDEGRPAIVILARTLSFCHAERARMPRVAIRTSISQDERVTDGHSYYSREVDRIGGFLECPPGRFVFLIDEIFRGTNTLERIVIAAATIRHLSAKNIVLVTTHDIELEGLLKNSSRMFHFSEQIEGERYYFDYLLRPGACRSGNAIRLIELRGYPADVVSETRSLDLTSQPGNLEGSKSSKNLEGKT